MNNAKQPGQTARKAGMEEGAARTLAQAISVVLGAILIAGGILGFFFGDAGFGAGPGVSGDTFLGFEVNGWHNVLHIVTGGVLLLMAAKLATAITGLLVVGIIYAVAAVWGFIAGDSVVYLLPVNGAANVLHLVIAAITLVLAVAAGGLQVLARSPERKAKQSEHKSQKAEQKAQESRKKARESQRPAEG